MPTEPNEVKIDKWDANACKNALDDAAKSYFSTNFKMEESFFLMDTKLVLCTTAVLVSGFACLYDWYFPFPQSKMVLISCIVLYLTLTALFTMFLMWVEKHTSYVGFEKDPAGVDPSNKWTMGSTVKNRFSPIYEMQLTCYNGTTKTQAVEQSSHSFAEFFDVSGHLVTEKFQDVLRTMHEKALSNTTKKTK